VFKEETEIKINTSYK